MKRSVPWWFRCSYMFVILACCGYLAGRAVQHTDWYKQRLMQRLTAANGERAMEAAIGLARLGAQDELLLALRLEPEPVRVAARRALEFIWSNAAGAEARERATRAVREMEGDELDSALAILDELIEEYPSFAEAWNRRGAVYWELGDYEQAMADCRRALALNPNLFGAWQGVGLCQLEMGDIAGACESLRNALKIIPHDESTRRSLRRCEELLRVYPHELEVGSSDLLI